VIYTALSEKTARAEFERLAVRQGRALHDFLPRHLYTLDVELSSVLDLTQSSGLNRVGLSMRVVRNDDAGACQGVGDAAHKLGLEAIMAPSATSSGAVLAIFEFNVSPESNVSPVEYVVWPR
jgi:RES domain-containing protein